MFVGALLVPSKGRLAAIRFYSLSRKKAASAGGTQTQDPSLLNADKIAHLVVCRHPRGHFKRLTLV